jgi:hypothetical protein
MIVHSFLLLLEREEPGGAFCRRGMICASPV